MADLEQGNETGFLASAILPPRHNSLMPIVDPHLEQPQSVPNRQSSRESGIGDSAGPLLSIYSSITKKADDKATERCQRDADTVLVFVSSTHPKLLYVLMH